MEEAIRIEFSEEDRKALREALADMVNPVEINVFVGPDCASCNEALKLARILREEAPERNGEKLIRVRVWEKGVHDKMFEKHGVERIPSITLLDGVIKYTGVPAGEEIRGFVETIIRISMGESGLEERTIRILREELHEPIHIEVIVTPPCPYCPYAALLANMFAFEVWKAGRRNLVSEVVEAFENPDIADRYGVVNVPAIAVNGVLLYVGVPYEEDFIEKVVKVVKEGWRPEQPEFIGYPMF